MLLTSVNTFTATLRLVFDQTAGHWSLPTLTYKINRQKAQKKRFDFDSSVFEGQFLF